MIYTHHKIYLIRHAETEWTLSGQHTGKTDLPLTEKGENDSRKIKEQLSGLGFQKVLVSPLTRAKRTCELAGFFDEAIIEKDLIEWDYGSYEGMTSAEIHKNNPSWSIFREGAPEGESIADVSHRAARVLGHIRSIPGDVAVFSSGHFLRVLAARWLDMPPQFGQHLVLHPASISILGYERNTPALLLWNKTCLC
jgi:broad specificity phosphatase PhoE